MIEPHLTSRATTGLYLAAAFLCLLAHLSWALPLYQIHDRILGASLFFVFLIWLRRAFRSQYRFVPIIPLYLFQVYLQYGLPQFSHRFLLTMSGRYVPSATAMTTASLLALGGEIALLLGYGAGTVLKRRVGVSLAERLSGPRMEWRLPVMVLAILGVVWHLAVSFGSSVPLEYSFLVASVFNPNLGLILVYLLSHASGSRPLRQLAIAMTLFLALAGLMTSMLELMLTPVLIFLACEWIWKKRTNFVWVLALVVFTLVMNPAKLLFRKMDWRRADPITTWSGVEQRIDKWNDSLGRTLTGERAIEHMADANSTRTGALLQLAQVVDWVPSRVPYQRGDVIIDSLIYLIPRFAWPEKPSISDLVNNRFALAFRVSDRRGLRSTTYGIVPPADGYWDFGAMSALAYLAATGLLLALVLAPSAQRPTTREQIVALLFCGTHLQVVLPMSMLIPWTASLVIATWLTFTILEVVSPTSAPGTEEQRIDP